MKNDKQPLKLALKTYYENRPLPDNRLQVLQVMQSEAAQKHGGKAAKTSRVMWFCSVAASLLLIIITLAHLQTPAIINAAYNDIAHDAETYNGMQSSVSQWLHENDIRAVPQKYRVEMSKLCQLDKYQARHLRIAGAEQGTLHLFFQHGARPFNWMNDNGHDEKINWKIINVRDDLTLIVMHTHDMREEAIQNILDNMLPELQA
jgi:hypothetical protein